MERRLEASFYLQDTSTVAQALLGKRLVHVVDGQRLSGTIVETEAYNGISDPACHSYGDRRTPRTASMYRQGGSAYVYFIYGMHFCFNVVTREEGHPEAVLIRAVEPVEGIDIMRKRRKCSRDYDLTNGPGKLCQALGIDKSCDQISLIESDHLFLEDAPSRSEVVISSPRIGVAYAGDAALWPLRFHLKGNPYASKAPLKRS